MNLTAIVAIITFFVAVATFMTAYATKETAKATKAVAGASIRLANLTHQQNKASLRPLVVPVGLMSGGDYRTTDDVPEQGTLTFQLHQVGLGPALDVRISLNDASITSGPPDLYPIGVFVPWEQKAIEAHSRPRQELFLPDMIKLEVTYRDVWDDVWRTTARTNSGRWENVKVERVQVDPA